MRLRSKTVATENCAIWIKSWPDQFQVECVGRYALIENFNLTTGLHGLTGQSKDGRFATEALTLKTRLEARNEKGLWQWQSHTRINGGALYIEPLYLETNKQPIVLMRKETERQRQASGNKVCQFQTWHGFDIKWQRDCSLW